MRDYIILNGVNSNTITGLLISTLPPITKPKIRTQTEEIDGRDGDIVTKLGYSAYDKEIEIGLYGDFDIDDVIAYFNSEGTVTFSNEPDKFYNYQILDQIDYEKLIRFKKAKVKMHVQPFKYPLEETPVEITTQTVNGEGETIDLNNTKEAPMTIVLNGNTSNNLLDMNNLLVGIYTPSATPTISGSGDIYKSFNLTLKKGTYSLFASSSLYVVRDFSSYDYSGNATLGSFPANTKSTFTITQDATVYFSFRKYDNTAWDSTKDKVWLVEGSDTVPYEPYGASVTGDNSIEVCGKNIIDKNNVNSLVAYIDGSGKIASAAGNYLIWIRVTQNTNYAFKMTQIALSTSSYVDDVQIGLYETTPILNATGTRVYSQARSSATEDYTYTTTFNSGTNNYVAIKIANTSRTDITQTLATLQLEVGTSSTTYEPYKGASYPISLGSTKLNTGDSIQYITDNWYIVRANETQEEITDATLIAQLEALANASSYDTKTHITQNANDKPFILNATAIQKGSGEATVNNEGNIYSKPTLDIEGTGTVGIYLDGNQIFSIDLSNSSECVIDTAQLEAYNPSTNALMNRQVTGDYSNFKLNAGDNQVQATGDITKVTISNYTRWL